jgi:hypothetical protein
MQTAPAWTIPAAPSDRIAWAFAFALCAGAMLVPAFVNGFPLIFADTGGYLARPFEHTLLIGRSALYGAFLAAGIAWDFWPNIMAQAAAAAWLMLLVLRTHGLGTRPGLAAALTITLALLTGLPWNASMLMPDIFAPLTVLALHLLAFRRDALSGREALAVGALVAAAIATHMGTLALGLGLLAAFAAFKPFARRLALPRPRLAAPALALVLGVTLALLSNFAITGKIAFTPGGSNFVFGRLVQDGIVARYMDERCPDPSLTLCAYRNDLPATADGWLWGWGSPLYKLGGPAAFAPEARAIILATLPRYPAAHVISAVEAAARQLVRLRTGEGVNPHDTEHAVRALARYAPDAMPRFEAARQQHDRFDFTLINLVHVPLALVCLALLPLMVLAARWRRIAPAPATLAFTVLMATLANAAICGTLSNPNDRYQSRIAWLAPFAFVIAAFSASRRATS